MQNIFLSFSLTTNDKTGFCGIMRQTACLVVNPVIVDSYALLFNCTAAAQASL